MRLISYYDDSYREEVIKPLVERIKKDLCSTVVIVRGAGLRPLFDFLQYHPAVPKNYFPGEDTRFIRVNFEEALSLEQKTILKEFLRELKNVLVPKAEDVEFVRNEYLQGIASEEEQEVLYRLKNLLTVAEKSNTKIVLLLQEFDELAKTQLPILNTLYVLQSTFRGTLIYIFGVHQLPTRLRSGLTSGFDYIFHEYIIAKPFSRQTFVSYYQKRWKEEDGLDVPVKQLELIYKYTGGLAAYNRYVRAKLVPSDLSDLKEQLEKCVREPQVLAQTKQILIDLRPEETQLLKDITTGKKVPGTPSLGYLKELGLVAEDGTIFAHIFATHLLELEQKREKSGLTVDAETKGVSVDGIDITSHLSPIEFKFLEFLFRHKGSVCERDEIIEYAWGGSPDGVADEAIDQLVSRLRAKIETEAGRQDLITTVRGRGFLVE